MNKRKLVIIGLSILLLVLVLKYIYTPAPEIVVVKPKKREVTFNELVQERVIEEEPDAMDSQYFVDYHTQNPDSWPVHSTPTTDLFHQKHHGEGELGGSTFYLTKEQKVAVPLVPRDFTVPRNYRH